MNRYTRIGKCYHFPKAISISFIITPISCKIPLKFYLPCHFCGAFGIHSVKYNMICMLQGNCMFRACFRLLFQRKWLHAFIHYRVLLSCLLRVFFSVLAYFPFAPSHCFLAFLMCVCVCTIICRCDSLFQFWTTISRATILWIRKHFSFILMHVGARTAENQEKAKDMN